MSRSTRNLGNPLPEDLEEKAYSTTMHLAPALAHISPGWVCARPDGFGSRHVCSEQVGRASLLLVILVYASLGYTESCEIPLFPGVGRINWRNGFVPGRLVAQI